MNPNAALPMPDFSTPQMRILLVEDAEVDAMAFRRALERSNVDCEITHCFRAEDAKEKLFGDATAFDVLVADHMLPGMYGLDLCLEILARDKPCALTLLTGSGSTEVATRALEAGIDEYIVKDSQAGYLDLLPVVLPRAVRRFEERQALRRSEESLRRCDERLRQLAENIREVFWIVSPRWDEFYFVGPAFREVWGRPCEDLYGDPRTWLASIVEADRARVIEELLVGWTDTPAPGRPRYSTFRIARPEGAVRRIECRVFALTDERGKVDRLAGTAADVTDRLDHVC